MGVCSAVRPAVILISAVHEPGGAFRHIEECFGGGIGRIDKIDELTAFTGGGVHGRSYDRNHSDSSGRRGDLEEKTG